MSDFWIGFSLGTFTGCAVMFWLAGRTVRKILRKDQR